MAEAALPPTASTQSRPTAIVAVVVAKGRDLLALRAGLSFPIYILVLLYYMYRKDSDGTGPVDRK